MQTTDELKRAAVLVRLLTVRQVMEAGDEAIEAAGLNPWAVNEGLATGDEKISVDFLTAGLASQPEHDTERKTVCGDQDCHLDRERKMLPVRSPDGRLIGSCDPCIEPIVRALNEAGIRTKASCCGHGFRPGNIVLHDGREIVLAADFDTARAIDRLFATDINGERAPASQPEAGAGLSVEWLWYGEDRNGQRRISFGRWQSHVCQRRYKLAEIQPTEHDHPTAPAPSGMGKAAGKQSDVFVFEPGSLTVHGRGYAESEGSGYFQFDESDLDFYPHDEKEGSFIRIRLDQSELVELRDFLVRRFPSALRDREAADDQG